MNDRVHPSRLPEPSPALLSDVFRHAVDAIFLADADTGLFLHANPAAGRLVGLDPRDLIGRHQSVIHPPAEAERYAQDFAKHVAASAARPIAVESTVRHADGRDIPVSINVSVFEHEGRRIAQGIFRDLTDWHLTLRALDHERARMLALIRAIPGLVWLKDPAGRYLACNAPFERLYGVKEEKLIGKTDFDLVDTETAEIFRDHDRRAIEAGVPIRNEEWVTFRGDGYRGLFETIKTPVSDSAGALIGVLGVAHDITELRRAQERLAGGEGTTGA